MPCGKSLNLNISFSKKAESDLLSIHSYIADENINIANQVITRILQSIAILEGFPLVGRIGRVEETRELIISGLPYIAIYHLASETELVVISVVHTRMKYPPA